MAEKTEEEDKSKKKKKRDFKKFFMPLLVALNLSGTVAGLSLVYMATMGFEFVISISASAFRVMGFFQVALALFN